MDALDQIAAEAAPLEAEQQQRLDDIENPPAPEPIIDPSYGWAQIPAMVGGMLTMAMPELQGVYNEAACMQWGTAMHAVATKHGWEAGETMARWAPEIALTMASLPLVVPVVHAVKARKAAAEKAPSLAHAAARAREHADNALVESSAEHAEHSMIGATPT